MTETGEEPRDPLDDLSPEAWMAFIFQQYGDAGLRQLIGTLIDSEDEPVDKAFLENAAAELEDLGLDHIGKVVREAAQEAPLCRQASL